MKFFLAFATGSLLSISLFAQENISWKVVLNKKTVLEAGPTADSLKNIIQVTKTMLDNRNVFKLDYSEVNTLSSKPGWRRTMALVDTLGTSIVERDSTSQFYLYNRDLMKALWGRNKLVIYTWAKPMDAGMAAAIRLRRTHLCTIELVDDPKEIKKN